MLQKSQQRHLAGCFSILQSGATRLTFMHKLCHVPYEYNVTSLFKSFNFLISKILSLRLLKFNNKKKNQKVLKERYFTTVRISFSIIYSLGAFQYPLWSPLITLPHLMVIFKVKQCNDQSVLFAPELLKLPCP